MSLETKFLKNTKQVVFGDFKTNLNFHPGSRDLYMLNEVDTVKQSVVNIIRTSRYDRPFQPTLGCYINDILFEDMSDVTLALARRTIIEAVQIHEPRAEVSDVIISPNEADNGLYVSIIFTVLNSNTPITLDIALDRIR
jgi:phage baseplate assembly protein W